MASHRATGAEKAGAERVEWIVGGVSAVVVVGMIGFILYQALAAGVLRPELTVVADGIVPTAGGFVVEFRAVNSGNATAAAVKVEGRLSSGERTVEASEVTLDYVPRRSEQKGGLIFRNDPRQYRLEMDAKGYMEP
jgi:uncharacterized protein (TIGR02588 family)